MKIPWHGIFCSLHKLNDCINNNTTYGLNWTWASRGGIFIFWGLHVNWKNNTLVLMYFLKYIIFVFDWWEYQTRIFKHAITFKKNCAVQSSLICGPSLFPYKYPSLYDALVFHNICVSYSIHSICSEHPSVIYAYTYISCWALLQVIWSLLRTKWWYWEQPT